MRKKDKEKRPKTRKETTGKRRGQERQCAWEREGGRGSESDDREGRGQEKTLPPTCSSPRPSAPPSISTSAQVIVSSVFCAARPVRFAETPWPTKSRQMAHESTTPPSQGAKRRQRQRPLPKRGRIGIVDVDAVRTRHQLRPGTGVDANARRCRAPSGLHLSFRLSLPVPPPARCHGAPPPPRRPARLSESLPPPLPLQSPSPPADP